MKGEDSGVENPVGDSNEKDVKDSASNIINSEVEGAGFKSDRVHTMSRHSSK